LGVRIFERPEDPQNGDSLAKPRRDARSARRRLKRRRQRLNHLKQFFIDQNILTKDQVEEVLDYRSDFNKLDVYELRAKALTEELSPEELLKVLYQIAKRRGFKSNRKVIEESDKEGGRVTSALKANEKFLADNNYTTVGDALSRDEKFAPHKRNKRDDYTNSFARDDFLRELEFIIKNQRKYALKNIPEQAINELIYGIDDGQATNVSAIMYQRPFMTRELIEKMVGNCTFEKDEKRAPKASYSFEVFRLASDLSHLVFIPRDTSKRQAKRENLEIRLSPEQISKVIDLTKNQKSLTYKKVRSTAGISEDYVPKDVRGKKKEGDEFGEDNTFGGLKAYSDIRLALKDLPEDWAKIDNESAINQIAYVLTTQKADEGIRAELDSLPLSDKAKEAIIKIKPTNFKAFGHLSIKALQNITPYILEGMTYDKACEAAGYDFKKQSASLEQITNPVVKRAITQTLKVVRAIERKYGKPYFIKVETARDLAKNFKDRKAIENENKENQARNQSIIQTLNENGVVTPTGQQIIKVKLYREQNGVCLYSGKSIDFETMLRDDNAYQVDHIVPFSRSNNDGMTNKVLVLTEENQKKSNQTPFEYFGADEKRWKEFAARVESTYKTRDIKTADKATNAINYKYNGYAMKKKQNLLLQDYKNDSWNVRALNDTRYITRFIQNYLRQMVDFVEGEEKQRVIAPNGTTTAYLRKRWGLAKDRAEDVLHHAKDAAVVAAIDQSIVRQANLFAKRGEIAALLSAVKTMEEKTDKLTGEIIDEDEFDKAQRRKDAAIVLSSKYFPQPWDNFGKEVMKRTLNTDIATLQNELRGLDNYDEDFRLSVKPIFVSRMPRRKATAQAHKETIRSSKVKDNDQRTVRMPLNKVKRKDVENSVLKESDKWLYDKLLERLNAHDNNPEKAFAEPVYKNDKKFDKNGKQLSPVSNIKVYSTQPSGFYINKGKAFVNNGSMVRLDVYQKPNKKGKIEHFFVPVYAHQVGKNKPTPTKILPAPKGFTDVDETFTKVCSLYPNDYVRCHFGNKIREGYYVSFNINNGAMQVMPHDAANKSNDSLIQISPRSANLIERYDIAILGDNYRWL
jgi:CRISPR-associated protein, csn1 family